MPRGALRGPRYIDGLSRYISISFFFDVSNRFGGFFVKCANIFIGALLYSILFDQKIKKASNPLEYRPLLCYYKLKIQRAPPYAVK